MKKFITFLFLTCLLGSVSYAQVKIGLPAGAPQASAVLDLSNTGDLTKALVLPRVTNTASIVTPYNGMIIYDLSSNCTKVYDNGTWSACLGSSPSGAGVNCAASTLNGNYNQGTALTAANTVTIHVANNTSSAITITPSITDINLSGTAAAGMSVASVSPASVTPGIGGGTLPVTYTLSGTPTAAGAFTATWTKLGLTCAKTGNVCLTMLPITVTSTTTPATLPIPTAAGNTIDFVAAGGTPNTGLTWAMTSNPATGVFSSATTGTGATAQAILVAGASGLVTVTFSAINACGLTVTGTQGVAVSDLSVNSTASAINGIYTQTIALTAANTVTIVLVNNSTSSAKTVTPLTSDLVLSGTGAAGISVASFSPASVSVAANGATSTITYTLSGTPTTVGSFTATWTKLGLSAAKTSTVCLAISPITVSNTTTPTNLPGAIAAGNTINFSASGGTPNTSGMSWTMSSSPATGVFSNTASGTGNTAQAVLIAGTYGTVTVTFTVANDCGLLVTGTRAVTVGDALRAALGAASCTSCAVYDAASADTWVQITAAEYAKIDSFVPVTIAAANEYLMTASPINSYSTNSVIQIGTNTSALPANNYIVAFSIIVFGDNLTANLKYSTSTSTGFSVGGPALSLTTTGTSSGKRLYNILKTPTAVKNSSSPTYFSIYNNNGAIGSTTIGSSSGAYSAGDVSSISTSYVNCPQYQVKGTTTKKW